MALFSRRLVALTLALTFFVDGAPATPVARFPLVPPAFEISEQAFTGRALTFRRRIAGRDPRDWFRSLSAAKMEPELLFAGHHENPPEWTASRFAEALRLALEGWGKRQSLYKGSGTSMETIYAEYLRLLFDLNAIVDAAVPGSEIPANVFWESVLLAALPDIQRAPEDVPLGSLFYDLRERAVAEVALETQLPALLALWRSRENWRRDVRAGTLPREEIAEEDRPVWAQPVRWKRFKTSIHLATPSPLRRTASAEIPQDQRVYEAEVAQAVEEAVSQLPASHQSQVRRQFGLFGKPGERARVPDRPVRQTAETPGKRPSRSERTLRRRLAPIVEPAKHSPPPEPPETVASAEAFARRLYAHGLSDHISDRIARELLSASPAVLLQLAEFGVLSAEDLGALYGSETTPNTLTALARAVQGLPAHERDAAPGTRYLDLLTRAAAASAPAPKNRPARTRSVGLMEGPATGLPASLDAYFREQGAAFGFRQFKILETPQPSLTPELMGVELKEFPKGSERWRVIPQRLHVYRHFFHALAAVYAAEEKVAAGAPDTHRLIKSLLAIERARVERAGPLFTRLLKTGKERSEIKHLLAGQSYLETGPKTKNHHGQLDDLARFIWFAFVFRAPRYSIVAASGIDRQFFVRWLTLRAIAIHLPWFNPARARDLFDRVLALDQRLDPLGRNRPAGVALPVTTLFQSLERLRRWAADRGDTDRYAEQRAPLPPNAVFETAGAIALRFRERSVLFLGDAAAVALAAAELLDRDPSIRLDVHGVSTFWFERNRLLVAQRPSADTLPLRHPPLDRTESGMRTTGHFSTGEAVQIDAIVWFGSLENLTRLNPGDTVVRLHQGSWLRRTLLPSLRRLLQPLASPAPMLSPEIESFFVASPIPMLAADLSHVEASRERFHAVMTRLYQQIGEALHARGVPRSSAFRTRLLSLFLALWAGHAALHAPGARPLQVAA